MKKILAALFIAYVSSITYGFETSDIEYNDATIASTFNRYWVFTTEDYKGEESAVITGVYDKSATGTAPVQGAVAIPDRVVLGGNGYNVRGVRGTPFKGSAATSITIPGTVMFIEGNINYGCNDLESFVVADSQDMFTTLDGALYDWEEKKLIAVPARASSIKISPTVETIGDGAFSNCFVLTSIELPESVADIHDNAFSECSRLKSITFTGHKPSSVGSNAFS